MTEAARITEPEVRAIGIKPDDYERFRQIAETKKLPISQIILEAQGRSSGSVEER